MSYTFTDDLYKEWLSGRPTDVDKLKKLIANINYLYQERVKSRIVHKEDSGNETPWKGGTVIVNGYGSLPDSTEHVFDRADDWRNRLIIVRGSARLNDASLYYVPGGNSDHLISSGFAFEYSPTLNPDFPGFTNALATTYGPPRDYLMMSYFWIAFLSGNGTKSWLDPELGQDIVSEELRYGYARIATDAGYNGQGLQFFCSVNGDLKVTFRDWTTNRRCDYNVIVEGYPKYA